MNFLQNWFRRWAHRFDRWLFGLTLVLLLLLVLSQLLLTNEQLRYYMNRVDFNEGVPYHWPEEASTYLNSEAAAGSYWVELVLHGGESMELLRNGEPAGLIVPAGTMIHVDPGDMLVVRGTAKGSAPLVVEVIATGGLLYPQAGTKIETYGDYDLIGWAIPDS